MAKRGTTQRIGAAIAVLGIVAVGAACRPAPAPARAPAPPSCNGPGGPPDAVTSTVFNRTNGQRGASGLGGLWWNPQLYCLAVDWSTQLGNSGTFQHRDLGSVLNSAPYAGYRTLGENILRGSASLSGDAMHDAWMASAAHAANILSPSYSSIGIGLYYINGQVYATENFGG
jgi:uncharacterized protein YkwD